MVNPLPWLLLKILCLVFIFCNFIVPSQEQFRMARDSKALLASMRSNNTPRNTFRRLAHHGCKEYDSWLGSQRPVSQRFFAVFGGTLVLHGGASLFSQHVRRILFIFINNTQTIYRRYHINIKLIQNKFECSILIYLSVYRSSFWNSANSLWRSPYGLTSINVEAEEITLYC